MTKAHALSLLLVAWGLSLSPRVESATNPTGTGQSVHRSKASHSQKHKSKRPVRKPAPAAAKTSELLDKVKVEANTTAPSPVTEPAPLLATTESEQLCGDQTVVEGDGIILGRGDFEKSTLKRTVDGLLSQSDQEAAYQALLIGECQYGGDFAYDYLLGRTALASGHANEAVFSLQRASNSNPQFAPARIDLARSYFAAGDNEAAREEFAALAALNPPPAAAAAIKQYLQDIDQRTGTLKNSFSASVQLEGGYSSNANSGTSIDRFGLFVLDDNSQRSASSFAGVGALAAYNHPINNKTLSRTTVAAGHRVYPDATFANSTGVTANTEVFYVAKEDLAVSAGVVAGAQWLGGSYNQGVAAVTTSAVIKKTEEHRLATNIRLGLLRYAGPLSGVEVKQLAGGVTYQWRPAAHKGVAVDVGPVLGREQSDHTPTFSRHLFGVVGHGVMPLAGHTLQGSIGFLKSDYLNTPVFGERNDRQLSARLALDVKNILPKWLITPQMSYVYNQSNVDLYEFRRFEAGLAITRELP